MKIHHLYFVCFIFNALTFPNGGACDSWRPGSGGRNTAFRPQDRTITMVDDLIAWVALGTDLHIATVDMEDETCLFRPLIVSVIS